MSHIRDLVVFNMFQLHELRGKAKRYLDKSQYYSMFKLLASEKAAARRALRKVNALMAYQEARSFKKKKESLATRELTKETLEDFSWSSMVHEVRQEMPTLSETLVGATSRKYKDVFR